MEWIDFEAPNTLDEAVSILASKGDRARVIAGGTDLLVQLRGGRRSVDVVVDIKNIPELNELSYDSQNGLTLGAAVPCYRIYQDEEIAAAYPGLMDAATLIGGIQIQGRAASAATCATPPPAATRYLR